MTAAKPRAQACVGKLAELNSYVNVSVLDVKADITKKEVLSKFSVVVCTDTDLKTQLAINAVCHELNIAFVATEIRGLFGMAFTDFGKDFVVTDMTGEEPLRGLVAAITKEKEGVVTCYDETRHGLEDGDYVTFTEVQGLEELNGCEPRRVKFLGPFTFSIGDTTNLKGDYVRGGYFHQVKMPQHLKFKSLKEAIAEPGEFVISDFAKFDRPALLHIGFQALDQFRARHNGTLPKPRNAADAEELVSIAKEILKSDAAQAKLVESIGDNEARVLKELAFGSRGDLSPMAAFFGGMIAQEVLKAASGKFNPIRQYFYFDALEALPSNIAELKEESFQPKGTRYDSQLMVFGAEFHAKIMNQKQFLVGAGAIGCEMLKNWAMMGLGTGAQGNITITDMDSIEKSNLNRQFLFRPWDVSKMKSETAASVITTMNPDLKGKIQSRQERVGPDTESVFNDQFWEGLSGVTNALDNVEARKYVDRRCVYYRKPLLESGTLGTKGNTQVVIPHVTESYSSSQDPPEKSIPVCTLKNFPNAIEHTIQWARDLFEGMFSTPAMNVNMYLSQPDYVEKAIKQLSGSSATDTLESVYNFLVAQKPLTFNDCITWARLKFEDLYGNTIKQLLFNFPKDAVTSTGQPFWSGPKRAPEPIEFDPENQLHMDFVVFAANLHAFNFGLKGETDRAVFKKALADVIVPEFAPKQGVKIQVQENENVQQNVDANAMDDLVKKLPAPSSLAGFRLTPVEFEKDDDTNFHIDFITAASNLRATNYSIQVADRHKTKFIAGKIIPAIATTTALVTGLVCLELYKIIDGKVKLEDYKNGFINLALPFFGFSEPIAAAKFTYYDNKFTLWDRFDVEEDVTLAELLELFQTKHKLEITMLSCGVSMLYSMFMPKKKSEERKAMKISKLVETVQKTILAPHVSALVLEMCANDEEGEDVEVPYIRVVVRP